ncbi:hypothetical protein ON010_g4014 [Phytophthora cinnamomi]|nr:hypothetical protein ON010_g4014 [Phytophthora cinnamomi]
MCLPWERPGLSRVEVEGHSGGGEAPGKRQEAAASERGPLEAAHAWFPRGSAASLGGERCGCEQDIGTFVPGRRDSVAHEWDVATQQFMRQFEGHEDFLHAVRHLQHSQELVTGSEGGTLGIWDVRQEKKIEFLRPQPATQSSSASPALPSLWLGAVAHDESEMWLACGGSS